MDMLNTSIQFLDSLSKKDISKRVETIKKINIIINTEKKQLTNLLDNLDITSKLHSKYKKYSIKQRSK